MGFCRALATVTGSGESARDAVQEGFARALRSRSQFRGGSLAAWVWRISLNAAREQRRREKSSLGVAEVAPADAERDPAVAEAIRQLPPQRRLIVFLRYFADFSYAEIADALEITEGTVAATLSDARAALREPLEGSRRE